LDETRHVLYTVVKIGVVGGK